MDYKVRCVWEFCVNLIIWLVLNSDNIIIPYLLQNRCNNVVACHDLKFKQDDIYVIMVSTYQKRYDTFNMQTQNK